MKAGIILTMALLLNFCSTPDKQSKQKDMESNPFFSEWDTPFGVPDFDAIRPEHFRPAFEKGMEEHMMEIELIAQKDEEPNFDNTIRALEESGELLRRVSDVFFNLTSANTNDSLKAIAKDIAPKLAAHGDNISMNEQLFKKVKAVYDQREKLHLNPEDSMLLEETYKGFVRGGAALEGKDRERFREINKELSVLTVQFGDNVLNETNDFQLVLKDEKDLEGLPGFVREMGAAEAKARGMENAWVFTLQKPSLIPFLQYSARRDLREKIFKGYIERGKRGNEWDNREIARRIAVLRAERAQLLGYPTHAAFVLSDNMAKTPERVYNLMDRVWSVALPAAKKEAATLQELIRREGNDFDLQPWDWWYYAEKVRKEKYDLDDELLKPYFELDQVRKGMFEVAHRLYGLTFEERKDIPKPHPDARTFEVFDFDGSHQAVLIMDFHPRESKRSGAWMSSYRKQYRKNGENVTPIITMVMNFTKPTGDTPSLLTFEEVSTMFHEFGHALHGMLSDCTYQSLSGTAVPRDFVELPSQIMENWASEPEVLKMYAKHYQTGEPIPDELIEKMQASRHFNQGFATVEFTAAAYLDMAWHTIQGPIDTDVMAFEDKEMERIGMIPEIVVRYRTPYFQHIFSGGYSAGYYSYQWAEVLDADAFEAFRENGIFDLQTAHSFRKNILERGGTGDVMEFYKKFRGREPDPDAMLRRRGLL
ncbi:MAG: M3 family metallopeptidase [Bacteroidales bacterium]